MKQLQDSGLNKALSEAGDGVLAVSPDRRVVFWNRAAERLLGYAPGEAIGRDACEVLGGRHPEGRDACRPECQVLAAAEEVRGSFEHPARARRGEPGDLNLTKHTLPAR